MIDPELERMRELFRRYKGAGILRTIYLDDGTPVRCCYDGLRWYVLYFGYPESVRAELERLSPLRRLADERAASTD